MNDAFLMGQNTSRGADRDEAKSKLAQEWDRTRIPNRLEELGETAQHYSKTARWIVRSILRIPKRVQQKILNK